jgi:hypothetical protein
VAEGIADWPAPSSGTNQHTRELQVGSELGNTVLYLAGGTADRLAPSSGTNQHTRDLQVGSRLGNTVLYLAGGTADWPVPSCGTDQYTGELQVGSGVVIILYSTWLEEQLTCQRHLVGLINTLEIFR